MVKSVICLALTVDHHISHFWPCKLGFTLSNLVFCAMVFLQYTWSHQVFFSFHEVCHTIVNCYNCVYLWKTILDYFLFQCAGKKTVNKLTICANILRIINFENFDFQVIVWIRARKSWNMRFRNKQCIRQLFSFWR
jgi:hypothetical protein